MLFENRVLLTFLGLAVSLLCNSSCIGQTPNGGGARPGTLAIQLTDSATHFAVAGTVCLAPDQPDPYKAHFAHYRTNQYGRVSVTLRAGNYLIVDEAPGHFPLRGKTGIAAGRTIHEGAELPPKAPPKEFAPEALNELAKIPDAAIIHGFILDDTKLRPIAGATLRLVSAGVEAISSDRGYYRLVIPMAKYPTGAETSFRDTLIVKRRGYRDFILSDVEIVAMVLQSNLELTPGRGIEKRQQPHKMGTTTIPSLPEEPTPLSKQYIRWISPKSLDLGDHALGRGCCDCSVTRKPLQNRK